VGKYCRAGPTTDDITAHAHCMLDTQGYKYIPRICNTSFPQQQWLRERPSVLRCAYIAFLVIDLTRLVCSDVLLWTVRGATPCGLVVVCFVGAKKCIQEIYFIGVSTLRDVLTLLRYALYPVPHKHRSVTLCSSDRAS
jgi:hypothetical protein